MGILVDNPAYVVLAQDLASDDCEWQVCTGKWAEHEAFRAARKMLEKDGRWRVNIRVCSPDPIRLQD